MHITISKSILEIHLKKGLWKNCDDRNGKPDQASSFFFVRKYSRIGVPSKPKDLRK